MKAIVLTCDRYRAVTRHMILKYDQIWPDHPFVFQIPYQERRGDENERVNFVNTPADIKLTVLELLRGLGDEEWVYWCIDDKYPIQLITKRIVDLTGDLSHAEEISGVLFCRCKGLLEEPDVTLYPGEHSSHSGEILLERKGWNQIWIHQFLRVKVLRYLFNQLPEGLPSAKMMDELKDKVPRLPEHRLFVTRENLAVFGESMHKGVLTQNCYDSIRRANIEIPRWFRRSNGRTVILGTL